MGAQRGYFMTPWCGPGAPRSSRRAGPAAGPGPRSPSALQILQRERIRLHHEWESDPTSNTGMMAGLRLDRGRAASAACWTGAGQPPPPTGQGQGSLRRPLDRDRTGTDPWLPCLLPPSLSHQYSVMYTPSRDVRTLPSLSHQYSVMYTPSRDVRTLPYALSLSSTQCLRHGSQGQQPEAATAATPASDGGRGSRQSPPPLPP
jgi:hypothetical protein